MANEAQLQKAKDLALGLRGLSPETLAENPLWGTINFRDVLADLRQIINIAAHLAELPVAIVPEGPMNAILSSLGTADGAVKRLSEFDLQKTPNPREERQGIADTIRSAAEGLLMATQGWIPFLAYQRGDVQKNISELGEAVVAAKRALDEAKQEIDRKKAELDSIITAAREASATVGVGHFTSDFAGEAVRLEKIARNWLRVTACFAALTLAVALVLTFVGLPSDASTARLTHFLTSKVVILILLLTGTLWCGRLYKAAKHQEAMNHHRANALKTFQAFVKAAAEDSTRDAVLLETTRSIFAISPSGYLDTSEPVMEPASKLLEIVRAPSRPGG